MKQVMDIKFYRHAIARVTDLRCEHAQGDKKFWSQLWALEQRLKKKFKQVDKRTFSVTLTEKQQHLLMFAMSVNKYRPRWEPEDVE